MTQHYISLCEVSDQVQLIQEAVEGSEKKRFFIEGIFMQGDIPNKNGRVYPKQVLFNETQKYINEYVLKNRAMGELGHPDSPIVNLDKVSHVITEMSFDGSNVRAKAKILDTPMGKIAQNLMQEGISFGVSSRALGKTVPMKNGLKEVTSNFSLKAIDIVADPSAPDAMMQNLMEGKSWVWENGVWKESFLEDIKESVDNRNMKIMEAFEKLFQVL